MVNDVSINQFYGTPLLALAQNANVNGGETLTKFEFAIMQQQMKNLGMTFEEFGLKIASYDNEGSSAKETRNNISQTGSDLNKAYKKQFGSKNGVSVAQTAELKADAIIKTALDMFKSEHPDIIFTPKSLGTRPQFTQPQYKDNSALYAMDLTDWANAVKLEYINATKLSNEALAALIIDNTNENTAILSAEMLAYANSLLEAVEDGTAQIINTVKDSEGNIIKTVRNAEGHIVRVVQDSANRVIKVVKEEGIQTRNTVKEVGADIINDNRYEHAVTRGVVIDEATRTRNVLRKEAHQNRQVTKRTAKETQELETMNTAISERLSILNATTAWPSLAGRIGDMQKQIAEADIPHEVKIELLQRIRNQLSETFSTDSELDKLQDIINERIEDTRKQINPDKFPPPYEIPVYPAQPDYVEPIFEKNEEKKEEVTPKPKEMTKETKEDFCEKPYKEPICTESTKEKITKNVNKIFQK